MQRVRFTQDQCTRVTKRYAILGSPFPEFFDDLAGVRCRVFTVDYDMPRLRRRRL